MPGPNLPEIPAPLKSIQHYLKIASEHDQRDPVVSYWARLYALQTGLKLSTKTTAENNFLLQLMDWLETTKKTHSDNEAITNDVAAQAHLENWALKLFLYADKNDREANFNKSVVQSFYTAGLLYDVLTTFGELTEEATENRKYAKWKATYIHNCLRNGETPVPGPMKEEGEEDNDNSNFAAGPEDDLLLDNTVNSEPEDNAKEEENQADEIPPNEPEGEPEIPDPEENQADVVPPNEPEGEPEIPDPEENQADVVPSTEGEGEPEGEPETPDAEENQADVVPPSEAEGEPETPDAEENQADVVPPSEAEGEPEGEPETSDAAEEAPSEPGIDPASGNEDVEASVTPQPTPPPNMDAFGFPAVPGGSSSTTGQNTPQAPTNTPYPTLPTPVNPNPYNPAPTPTSPTIPTNFTPAAKPAGDVHLDTEQLNKAQKYIKWAGSAINYDDVPTAIGNLQKALHLLTTGQDS